jgi:hypothetical protein
MEDLSVSGLNKDMNGSGYFLRRAGQSSFKPIINTRNTLLNNANNGSSFNLFSPRSINSGTFPLKGSGAQKLVKRS